MAAPYVQEIGKNSKVSAAPTLVVTAAASATPGNLLVIRAVGGGGTVVSSVSDIRGNSWSVDIAHGTSPKPCICSTMQNIGAIQAGDLITVNFNVSNTPAAAIVDEFSRVMASPLDKTATGTAVTTNRAAGTTATLAQASELVIACFASGAPETAAWAAGAGFSNFTTPFLNTAGTIIMVEGEWEVVASTAAVSPVATGVTLTSNGVTATYLLSGPPSSDVLNLALRPIVLGQFA